MISLGCVLLFERFTTSVLLCPQSLRFGPLILFDSAFFPLASGTRIFLGTRPLAVAGEKVVARVVVLVPHVSSDAVLYHGVSGISVEQSAANVARDGGTSGLDGDSVAIATKGVTERDTKLAHRCSLPLLTGELGFVLVDPCLGAAGHFAQKLLFQYDDFVPLGKFLREAAVQIEPVIQSTAALSAFVLP